MAIISRLIQCTGIGAPPILVATILVQATFEDFATIAAAMTGVIESEGRMRLLIRFKNFQGTINGDGWEPSRRQCKQLTHVDRVAVVGDTSGASDASTFLQALRSAQIRRFPSGRHDEAVRWLGEPASVSERV